MNENFAPSSSPTCPGWLPGIIAERLAMLFMATGLELAILKGIPIRSAGAICPEDPS